MQDEKTVMLITGTSRGIGLGVAEYFVKKDYLVEGCSRSKAELEAKHYRHTQVDVRDESQVISWVRGIKRKHGKIDVVFNNAAVAPAALLAVMTTVNVLNEVFDTNVIGSYVVCREAALSMAKRKFGRIINVSSMAVGLHEQGASAYAASKTAVIEFTRIMAKELAPFNITCNVIAPSMIKTKAVEDLGEKVISRALSKLTIKRTVTLDEICHVLDFLIDPKGGVITGQVINMGLISA